MTVDEKTFREAMRFWTTGVTIATTWLGGLQRGLTVSSFTSVSVAPPVVLVSINRFSRSHQMIQQAGIYAVTILEESQQALASRFAGLVPEEEDRFTGVATHTLATGCPILEGGVASFDCRVIQSVDVGDNTIFLGEVLAAEYHEKRQPLLYSNRAYQTLKDGQG
jgi:flavin reductase (DIM6/NTAB) family NADH-FMN oxidoreductase RutF